LALNRSNAHAASNEQAGQIQSSGWRGPIGIISDRNIDSKEGLQRNLEGFASLKAHLEKETLR
jgi:hypothetical protein